MANVDSIKFYNVIVLGLGFFFLFTAFQTSGIFQPTSLNSYFSSSCNASKPLSYASKIGYFNYFIIYGMLAFGNWVAAPIVALLTPKWSMVIGAAAYCLFMAALIRPLVYLLFPAAAILGFAGGFVWTAQGNFLTMNSSDATIGRNSGIFWFMLQQSLLFGNLFVFLYTHETHSAKSTCISKTQNEVIYIVLTAFGVCGIGILALLRPIKQEDENFTKRRESPKTVTDEKTVMLKQDSETDSSTSLSLSVEQVSLAQKTFTAFVNSFKLMRTSNMILLCICFFYTGLELEMWSGVFVSCVGKTESLGASYVALTGVAIGIGEIVGGGLFGIFGKMTSRYGRDLIVVLGMVVHMGTFLLMYYVLPEDCPVKNTYGEGALFSNEKEVQLPVVLIAAFLIGFGDSCYNTQIYSILGGLYKGDKSAPAMALFKFFQSIAAMIGFSYSGFLHLQWQLLILVIMAVIGAMCFAYVELTNFKSSKSKHNYSIAD